MAGATVKICGLQNVRIVESMLHLPIDHIGFVFAKSKRQVTPEQAGEMIRFIKTNAVNAPLTVGVFVNPTKEQLMDALREAELDVVQLHGQETPEFCRWVKETLGVQVYRVFSIAATGADSSGIDQLDAFIGSMDAFLLDTVGGGTGKTFAWDHIPAYKQWADEHNIPLIVAGGLDADNVRKLLDEYAPHGVDVSSGVETDGVKDIAKITAFVERVKTG